VISIVINDVETVSATLRKPVSLTYQRFCTESLSANLLH